MNIICKNCEKQIKVKRKRIFCNSSCAAFYNNRFKAPISEETKQKIKIGVNKWRLENPEKISKGDSHSKKVGQALKGKLNKNISSIYGISSRTAKKILKRIGIGCSNCGWNESTCDIHHIEGRKIPDCHNHNNLSLLCPNCHRLVHDGLLNKDKLKNLNEILPSNWKDFYYG